MQGVSVVQATDSDETRWNAYVQASEQATFFHLFEWRQLLQAQKFETYYLLAEDQNGIAGLLPLARVKSLLFGDHLVSLPFCVNVGVIASSSEAANALLDSAVDLAKELGVEDLELRSREPVPGDWHEKNLYALFRKEIPTDEDEMMSAIPRKQRAMVRKGIKANLTAEISREIDPFFNIYAESVRNLGTPVFSKRYLASLLDTFGEAADVLLVKAPDGQVVAAVMNFYFKNEVLPYYGGSISAARPLKANDFMYWELMRHAVGRGANVFDYGRSRIGTGPYSFKKNWGFDPQPLAYQYHLVKASEVPQVNPKNPKYELMINTWKRLPLPVANTLGPWVSRFLG